MLSRLQLRRFGTMVGVFLIAGAVSSCSAFITSIPKEYVSHYAKPEMKIPLRIGLLLPSNIRDITVRSSPRTELIVHLGDSISRNAEGMIRAISSQLTVLSDVREVADTQKREQDAIITAEITDIRLHLLQESFNMVLDFMVAIKWTVTDSAGKVRYVNTVTGESRYSPYRRFGFEERANECIQKGIDDEIQKAQVALTQAKWWQRINAHGVD